MRNKIFLIGMMGVGKTAVGNQLSELLDIPHIDNDQDMAERVGTSIQGLSLLPVSELHELEIEQTRYLLERSGPFIAGIAASLGDQPALLAALYGEGTTIYLSAGIETLIERFGYGSVGRQLDPDQAEKTIRTRTLNRDPNFQKYSHHQIDCNGPLADVVAQAITLVQD